MVTRGIRTILLMAVGAIIFSNSVNAVTGALFGLAAEGAVQGWEHLKYCQSEADVIEGVKIFALLIGGGLFTGVAYGNVLIGLATALLMVAFITMGDHPPDVI